MDKRNFTIGVVLLIAALAILVLAPRSAPPMVVDNVQPSSTPATATAPGGLPAATPGTPSGSPAMTRSAAPITELAGVNAEGINAQVTLLTNDFIEVRLTNLGGAVRDVALKQHAAVLGRPEPYVFNLRHDEPLLALT